MKQLVPDLPCTVEKPLDKGKLGRLGVVAIGRAMQADACIARLSQYR